MLYFKQIYVGGYDNNFSYFIGDTQSKETLVVDPWNCESLIDIAGKDGMRISKIVGTHKHHDHIGQIPEMYKLTEAEIYIHELDARPLRELSKLNLLQDQDIITVGKIKIKVLHTPGHSPGAICLLVDDRVITGDTLFVEGCGRTDLAGGNTLDLYKSLYKVLYKLPDGTEVYPGHDYGSKPSSTIGEEKKNNPYLKCKSKEEFIELRA